MTHTLKRRNISLRAMACLSLLAAAGQVQATAPQKETKQSKSSLTDKGKRLVSWVTSLPRKAKANVDKERCIHAAVWATVIWFGSAWLSKQAATYVLKKPVHSSSVFAKNIYSLTDAKYGIVSSLLFAAWISIFGYREDAGWMVFQIFFSHVTPGRNNESNKTVLYSFLGWLTSIRTLGSTAWEGKGLMSVLSSAMYWTLYGFFAWGVGLALTGYAAWKLAPYTQQWMAKRKAASSEQPSPKL